MKNRIIYAAVTALIAILASCKTIEFDKQLLKDSAPLKEAGIKTNADEIQQANKEAEQEKIENELKEVDVDKTVVYVKQPVYVPAQSPEQKPASGKEAAKQSTADAIQKPDYYIHGTMYYDYDDDYVYEVYAQPYRVTDIVLEPGEQVLEMPFMSENKPWVLGAGVSQNLGKDVQHFFIKPIKTNLETTMTIITDKRVYHLLLKSYKDTYMTIVKWNYPNSLPFTVKTDAMQEKVNKLSSESAGVNPEFLSFDYKMSYSIFKKPVWCPKLVYDDGRRTYIRMNPVMLHRESPVLFDKTRNLINYHVDGALVVIDRLIEKVTLRYGSEKVTIQKKNYNPKYDPTAAEKTAAAVDASRKPARAGIVIGTEQAEEQRISNMNAQEQKPKAADTAAPDSRASAAQQDADAAIPAAAIN